MVGNEDFIIGANFTFIKRDHITIEMYLTLPTGEKLNCHQQQLKPRPEDLLN